MSLSLSTRWNAYRHDSGERLIDEIIAAGFNAVEVGYDTPAPFINGIRKRIDAGRITVSSVHNFCPIPDEVTAGHPEIYELAALSPQIREEAIAATITTITTAAELGAPFVIVHAGNIKMRSLSDKLVKLIKKGKRHTKQYEQKKMKLLLRRSGKAQKHIDALLSSLQALQPVLEKENVVLAIENLPTWEALPTEAEMETLLTTLQTPHIGCWFDLGHGQIKENLGLISNLHWIKRLQPWIRGMHLHDVKNPARDHLMPPEGDIDFKRFADVLSGDHQLVLEPAPGTPLNSLINARDFFKKLQSNRLTKAD